MASDRVSSLPFDTDELVSCYRCGPSYPLLIIGHGRKGMILCSNCDLRTHLIVIGMALIAEWEDINDNAMFQ